MAVGCDRDGGSSSDVDDDDGCDNMHGATLSLSHSVVGRCSYTHTHLLT